MVFFWSIGIGQNIGIGATPVTNKCKGLEYESCDDWYHTGCVGITNAIYKGLVLGNGKLGLLWFCKTCLVRIRGFIRSSSVRPMTNEDSPKDLSQRSPNTEILNSEEGNSNNKFYH